jgi:hypothetical protein
MAAASGKQILLAHSKESAGNGMLGADRRNSDMHQKTKAAFIFARPRIYRGLILFLLVLFCMNVAAVSIFGGYDFRIGFIHLTAHGLFKPILMMNACFIVALMICGAGYKDRDAAMDFGDDGLISPLFNTVLFIALIIMLVLIIYYPSIHVNLIDHDWTHRHISAGIHSLKSAWDLFTRPQADGFYRPLTFLSLWLDYRLFGSDYAGYHTQSIALHIINSLLVAWLAMVLGFGRKGAWWTGLLFGAAAVNFEAVIWPAARFDLLATMFTLLALISAIKYFRGSRAWAWTLPASLLCYVLGIMNKESSYCFLLLILFIVITHPVWKMQRPAKANRTVFFSFAGVATAVMVAIRIAVYGNLGGYPTVGVAESHHFKLHLKTIISLMRAMPIPIFGVNSTPAAPHWMPVAAAALAVIVLLAALLSRGSFRRREYALVACIAIGLIPVANIVGWLGPPMQHCRYLYIPAIFVMLLIVSTLGKVRWSVPLLEAFLIINAVGAASNIQAYLNVLDRIEKLAESIRADWIRHPSAREICLVNIPVRMDGVFYFGSELEDRVGRKIPSATILLQETYVFSGSETPNRFVYRWSDADRTLRLVGVP